MGHRDIWDTSTHFNITIMHPLDKLFAALPAVAMDSLASPPAAPTPQPPGGQAVVVKGGEEGAVVGSPLLVSPFPPLQPGEELEELTGDSWPTPCPTCGRLEAWWDGLGRQRCQRCDLKHFERAMRLLQRASRLRERKVDGKSPT